MDWEFVNENPIAGGRYLRLYIQSKRAISNKSQISEKWYYRELDHASPKGATKGSQAQTLISAASTETACLPLYMFYHPESALKPGFAGLPAVEGVNIVLASSVAKIVHGGCGRKQKTVDYWRPMFLKLSDILCWPVGAIFVPQARMPSRAAQFMRVAGFASRFSPSDLAERLNMARVVGDTARYVGDDTRITASDEIPASVLRAIQGEMTEEDRRSLKRPRAIFSTRSLDDILG